jgi:hypothetical protein
MAALSGCAAEPQGVAVRPRGMQSRARCAAIVAVVVAAIAVAACAGPVTITTAPGPLLTVETRGGECPAGTCGTTVILERDGRVRLAAKPPNELGVVPPAQLAAVAAAIASTDFAAIRSRPFTGECPTAFDGQEIIFEFAAPGGVQRISTCEVEVDFGLPIFVAVSTALGPYVPLPIT